MFYEKGNLELLYENHKHPWSKEFMKYLHPSVPRVLCDTKHGQWKSPFSHDTWQASWEKSNLVGNFDLEGLVQIHLRFCAHILCGTSTQSIDSRGSHDKKNWLLNFHGMGLRISVSVFVKISHPGDQKKATVWKYKVFLFKKKAQSDHVMRKNKLTSSCLDNRL